MMQRPSIDHSLLSPSGRMSAQARKRALDAEGARLFPPGFWEQKQTETDRKEADIKRLQHSAQTLRELADRGMSVRRFRREAAKLETAADVLLGLIPDERVGR